MTKKEKELLQIIAQAYKAGALDLRHRVSEDGSGITYMEDMHVIDALLDMVDIVLETPNGKRLLREFKLDISEYTIHGDDRFRVGWFGSDEKWLQLQF